MNKTASAIGLAGLGYVVLWSGVTNAGVLASVQSLFAGTRPIPGTPTPSVFKSVPGASNASFSTSGPMAGGSGSGSSIANAALKYQGYPYVWGGRTPGVFTGNGWSGGWDCYGFTTYVLHHDLGYNLPNNNYSGYIEMLSWGGATKISASQIQAGDILLWPTHTGIAISSTEMISAENPSAGTKIDTFQGGGPLAPEPLTVIRVNGSVMVA